MKVSKGGGGGTQCVYYTSQRQKVPGFAHKQNIGRTWSIEETQDSAQIHSQGVKQIIAQNVFFF